MKRISLLILCMVLFCSVVNAKSIDSVSKISSNVPKIAVVLAGDKNMISEERIIKEIDKQIEKKFPENKYNVIKDNKVYQELLIVAEDHNVVNLDQLKRDDFINAGEKFGYDYVIVLPFYNEGGQYTTTGWTNIISQNITLRARIVDVKTQEYLYRIDVTKQGEAGNGFGSPSPQRAQKEAISKCLNEVFKDLTIGEKYEVQK
ncbi:MAG: hypothetical protein H6Q70_519 [Firmicutes bacterium]|nr:hypothetical protein [Bacillota bacterium]